jgi:hypothetical protein
MIGLVHSCIPKPSSYSWAVSLFYLPGLSPRRVLTVENENGRWHGKSMHNARLC